MFRIKASTFIVHIAGWLIFMSLPLLFSVSPRGSGPSWDLLSSWTYWKFCLVFIIVFYLNTALLVPQLFLKKKFLLYAASLLALFAMVYYLRPFDQLQRKHIADRGMAFRQGNPGRSGTPVLAGQVVGLVRLTAGAMAAFPVIRPTVCRTPVVVIFLARRTPAASRVAARGPTLSASSFI
ncbi:hypothetical protein MKQ70_08275 [Chitinophaga sedimenti]|uniref:hypothetical protein n=1 Tax=Chitinophaga sedimenti TaxID=2033606 RepID=UPI00200670F9|nr:hypothetical protein [Chitinophaga sedimenti]MCK7555002.1 hypothetical protein [Chitinophaga sedimenti]